MNTGTIIRTILAVATCLTQFHNEKLDLAYRIISVVLNFVIVACVTWFNNDYTPEACEGTGYTRMLKAEDDGLGIEVEDYLEDGDDNE